MENEPLVGLGNARIVEISCPLVMLSLDLQ